MSERKPGSILFGHESVYKAVFEAIPYPVFVADEDLRILHSNIEGHSLMRPTLILFKNRCGDLLRCRHALASAKGCGSSEHCLRCAVRRAVLETYRERKLIQSSARMQVARDGRVQDLFLLITTAPFELDRSLYVLLTLEDIGELAKTEAGENTLQQKASAEAFDQLTGAIAQERIVSQENMALNVTNLLLPLIEQLRKTALTQLQQEYLGLIVTKIREITSPLYRTLSGRYFGFTPMEIRVSDLIRVGKTSKEIAAVLGTSLRAIHFHRNNIRTKMGITGHRESLKKSLADLG